MKEPAKQLEKLRKAMIKIVLENISFIIERSTMSFDSQDIVVSSRTSEKKLPLYTGGQYGGVNQALAIARLEGNKEPYFSQSVYEALSKRVEELLTSDDYSGKEVINYCQGKLCAVTNLLKLYGETNLADLAFEWALIGSD